MDDLTAPKHHESILTVLSKVPIATTKQIGMLNTSINPSKKASSLLRELETEGLVKNEYHRNEKIWMLTRAGRKLQKCTPMNWSDVDHSLAIANLYFTVRPSHWMYEPCERFDNRYWKPDCILVHNRKVYVVEIQLTPISSKRWTKKWNVYNQYFNEKHFEKAKFQSWAKRPILPQILCATSQQPETVRSGFNVVGRDILIVRNFMNGI